jgi:hypothetical protein
MNWLSDTQVGVQKIIIKDGGGTYSGKLPNLTIEVNGEYSEIALAGDSFVYAVIVRGKLKLGANAQVGSIKVEGTLSYTEAPSNVHITTGTCGRFLDENGEEAAPPANVSVVPGFAISDYQFLDAVPTIPVPTGYSDEGYSEFWYVEVPEPDLKL